MISYPLKGVNVMKETNLRTEERFPAALLPHHLQTVTVMLRGQEAIGVVVDASLSGFGFVVQKSVDNFILGSTIAIYPGGTRKALYGTVVFARTIDEGNSRVGVRLLEVGRYLEYRVELQQIIHLAEASVP